MIKQAFKRPYAYAFILIVIAYLTINIILSEFYITIQYIPRYLDTIKWHEFLLAGIFSIIIAAMVAINIILLYLKWKERRFLKQQSFLASLGTLAGFSTGICPACITGLFPLLFAALGTSFTFLSLPFKGLEIQLLVIIILMLNIYFLEKREKTRNLSA